MLLLLSYLLPGVCTINKVNKDTNDPVDGSPVVRIPAEGHIDIFVLFRRGGRGARAREKANFPTNFDELREGVLIFL